ncbi:extracellular calcium-sensing receptor-like [Pleurodeles waltl]|uniref:extracellular calcium-sensing receptor-like n=1 Tax=Pleurodeles waltl TaxID=8319 RepID=UPI0037094F68
MEHNIDHRISKRKCNRFYIPSYVWAQAMAFTVNEINQEQKLMPNATLGFHLYDTCLSMERLLKGSMWMLTGKQVPTPNYRCQSQPPLVAIVGDSTSTRSIPMARLLGLSRQPQVSYYASSPMLSDKLQFPSFFRTIPSQRTHALGIAQFVVHFHWTWVGILSTDNDFGEVGSQIVKGELQKSGVCIAFHEIIPLVTSVTKIKAIAEVIRKSSANVIIMYATEPYRSPVINELSRHNLTGKVWIDAENLLFVVISPTKEVVNMLSGTFRLGTQDREMSGFKEFLLGLHPFATPNDIFLKSFWQEAFGCQWKRLQSTVDLESTDRINRTQCSGAEVLKTLQNPSFDRPDLKTSYNIYNAVFMAAHALMDMNTCVPGQGPFFNNTCAALSNFKPWQFLYYMKNVRFKNRFGGEISFDSNGDPPVLYTIFNLQVGVGGTTHSVIVGSFDAGAPAGQQLHVNRSAIRWNMQRTEVPHSACSESCAPGYRKAAQNGRPACCFDCVLCAEGEVSNETDSGTCWRCPNDQWPNEKRTACVPKTIEYLSYQEPLGVVLSAIVTFSSILTTAIWLSFFKNRHTPVVKANNRELSYFLLGGILLCFLCCLLFIGEPQKITCILRQPTFGVVFIFCVSCVLSKTIMVVIAFNATKPGSNMRKWLGPRVTVVTVSGCTFLQVLLCAAWLLNCPPFPEKNMELRTGTVIFQCNECSKTAFWCVLGYMGVLACASFVVAFLARKLPDNFNEAKWITFSMLVFLSVWLSFIPGYLSTHGKYMVAVEVFSIISSSAGLLTCVFFPKCFIIILRPDLNTRRHLFGKGDGNTQKIKAI